MAKEWDDFQKNFKKIQQSTKSLKPSEGEKLKKQLIADLNKAWDEETLVRKAIKKAQQNGAKADKLSSLISRTLIKAGSKQRRRTKTRSKA